VGDPVDDRERLEPGRPARSPFRSPPELLEPSEGKLLQRVDLGDEHQMVLELRPAHDPRETWGFVAVVISVADLSASISLWHRENGDDFRGLRVHQTRLQGGDASSDSYCFVD
jgi:hypothetical protein